jgi:hypothetical protein
MNDSPAATVVSSRELADLLRQVDPSALLVPPRILRRVIKQDRGLSGLGLQVPHRKSYVIKRDALLQIAGHHELGIPADAPLPETLLLLPEPDPVKLKQRGRGRSLVDYWRLLFHARIHRALEQSLAAGKLTDEDVRRRIAAIGLSEWAEVRAVLRQEHFLLPPVNEGAAFTEYAEFAALYWELRYFVPRLLKEYFPGILLAESVEAVLRQDVDAAELFKATRLPGAPDPVEQPEAPPAEQQAAGAQTEPREPQRVEGSEAQRLLDEAVGAAGRGNVVRSAINRAKVGADAGPDLDALAGRLRRALGLSQEQAAAWRAALETLLAPAARGFWSVEGRFLYDVQKVCLDQEREIYAVDLVEWIVSWGHRPVLRLLPYQQDLLTVKHLRAALHRLTAVRVSDDERLRLAHLVYDALEDREHRLRDRMRPAIVGVLDKVGLTPENVAEGVSRDKLVEELLDRALERGFLSMGDLRDAIARNRVKLPDLVNPVTFFLGDRVIRANRGMAAALDGIYRRGEIYLRWLQRLSSLLFGNPVGRFLVLYLVLPFGTSYMAIKAWEEIEGLAKEALGLRKALTEEEEVAHAVKHGHGVDPYVWLGLGVFILLLMHVPAFRKVVWVGLKGAWTGICWLLSDLPRAILRLSWVQRVLRSRLYLVLAQALLKPLPWGVLVWLGLRLCRAPAEVSLGVGGGVFVLVCGLLNSRWGLMLEENTTDWLVRTWHLIHSDWLPGLVRWILYVFRRLVDGVERILYTVDEWLRFRPGDSRVSLFVKPVLGLVWFCFAYVIRIVINLFVEPTFNPIKHFPVVTVTAKLLLPMSFKLRDLFAGPLIPVLGERLGHLVAWCGFFLLPGLAGFLVWELKENWRLYRANQSPTLDPEVVGSHGETVLRLLRPGVHCGTVPKLYAKLRRAKGRSARRQREALFHVRERLHDFVERDLLAILATSKAWAGAPRLHVGKIHLATRRIRVEVAAVGDAGGSLFVELEERAGWLLGGTSFGEGESTWLARLDPRQVLAFRDALAGFYKLAGVTLVREQVEAALPPRTAFDVTEEGLAVWPAAGTDGVAVYPLEGGPELAPRLVAGNGGEWQLLAEKSLLFAANPVWWEDWVRTWQKDHDGQGHAPLLPEDVHLLRR